MLIPENAPFLFSYVMLFAVQHAAGMRAGWIVAFPTLPESDLASTILGLRKQRNLEHGT